MLLPVATTVNVAAEPDDTDTDDGWVVILGALVVVDPELLLESPLSPPQACRPRSATLVSAVMPT